SSAGAAAQAQADGAPARAAARARIEAGRTAQEIAGFGASGAFHMADLLERFPADERGRVLDALFATTGTGAGLSMVRNIIPAGDRRAPGIEPASGQWNWEGDAGQIRLMREAAQRGCTRFVSTAWTPPAWMKTNNNIVGGRLRRDRYDDYAEYLAEYVAQYRSRHGLDIHAISPQNEPDVTVKYASCYWSGEEYREFVKSALGPAWRRRKPAARILLGEPSTWTEAPVAPALEDAEAREAIDIVAAHAYFGDNAAPEIRLTDRIGDFPVARGLGKPIWQTEVSAFNGNDAGIADALYWAKLLHFHLAENNVSGWFYWWLVSPRNDREALVQLDPASQGWLPNKRLFALGQYSRFVRPGARRVEAGANPAPGVYVSAYRQGEGLAIVAINDNKEAVAAEFAVAGLAPKTVEGYRTSAFEELRPLKAGGAGPFGAGGPFGGGAPTLKAGTEGAEAVVAATLAGESVTTYVTG
ncbi:MAG: glycoside hydrolase family 30 protein, partial [Terriglobales bacterium]